jgi:hypothetical protein
MDILVPVMQMWDNKRNNVYLCWKPEAAFDQHTGEFIYDDRVHWIPLTACGSGAIAIRRRVLESLPYPWFQYEYSTDFQLITSEDVYFTARAKAAHFSIFGYTKALTGHYHTVDLSAISPKIEPITPEPESPKLTLAPLVPKNNSPQKP